MPSVPVNQTDVPGVRCTRADGEKRIQDTLPSNGKLLFYDVHQVM